jgi:hypothetical protein
MSTSRAIKMMVIKSTKQMAATLPMLFRNQLWIVLGLGWSAGATSSGARTGATTEVTTGASGGDENRGTGGSAVLNVCEKLGTLGTDKLTADVFIAVFYF